MEPATQLADRKSYSFGTSDDASSFLRDVGKAARLPHDVEASASAMVTGAVLAERISRARFQHLLAELPLSVRNIFAEPRNEPSEGVEAFERDEFVRRVAERLDVDLALSRSIVPGVFRALRAWLSAEQVADVASRLPRMLEREWLSYAPNEVLPSGRTPTRPSVHLLIRKIEAEGPLPEGLSAVRALDAVLRTMALYLADEPLTALSAALPDGVRLMPAEPEAWPASTGSFVGRLGAALHIGEDAARQVVDRVFLAAGLVLPVAFVETVSAELPADARAIWIRAFSPSLLEVRA
ncbi:MAG TPA: DUF2267 domain-containing protein [Polyangiales bacterium]